MVNGEGSNISPGNIEEHRITHFSLPRFCYEVLNSRTKKTKTKTKTKTKKVLRSTVIVFRKPHFMLYHATLDQDFSVIPGLINLGISNWFRPWHGK